MTREKFRDFVKALYDGEATPEGIKKNWESFNASRQAMKDELNGFTFKQLKQKFPRDAALSYSDIRKGEFIDRVVDRSEDVFNPNNFISYDVFDRTGESRRAAYQRAVESWTPEKIAEQAERIKQASMERQAQRDAAMKALENPQSLEDFRTFIAAKGRAAMTREQAQRYDAVSAEASRSARREQEQAAKAKQIASTTLPSGVGIEVKKGWHAKKQQDTYVASISDRVDRDTYNELLSRAKGLGGYYSSYNKGGAVPGFQFPSEEAAKKFASMGREEIQRPDNTETRQQKASERLRELADRAEEQAKDSLNQERLANTARRARMAANAEDSARSGIAFAGTMRSIADAIESGQAKYLDRVSTMADVAQFSSAANHARYQGWRNQENRSRDPQDYQGQPSDADFARYPYPSVPAFIMNDLERQNIPGIKRALSVVQQSQRASYNDDVAEIKSPEALEALRKITPYMSSYERQTVGLGDYDRMQRLDIKTEEEYREALREFIRIKQDPAPRDQIKEMERAMIGRKIPGYFPTPPAVVDRALELADVREGQRVLEPSAGKGNIAERLREAAGRVETVEIDSSLTEILEAKGFEPRREDFLSIKDGSYDRIVMNPPFEKGQDMDHVQHAYSLLAPGGRLVSVMGEGGFFRSDKQSTAFREWAEQNGGYSERLPEGSFKNSENPTGVSTRLFVIEKPSEE
jgi:protein-L-isoaspartate O-methyltransferase